MIIIANELIPVYEDNGKQAVNTRDLHEFLEVGRAYSDWFKYRADQMGLIEGEDFITNLGKSTGGRPVADFIVHLDTAKEIAMMENNDKGREVRRYFIAVEKSYHKKPMSQLEVLAATAQALVDQDKRISLVETKQTAMIDALTAPAMMDWANDMNSRINLICKTYGKNYQAYRHELYSQLEATARCNLTARQSRLRDRMKMAGHKHTDIMAVSKIHVIANDPKLRAIFEGIIRTEQVKYAGEAS